MVEEGNEVTSPEVDTSIYSCSDKSAVNVEMKPVDLVHEEYDVVDADVLERNISETIGKSPTAEVEIVADAIKPNIVETLSKPSFEHPRIFGSQLEN